jgi:hypothetical protein
MKITEQVDKTQAPRQGALRTPLLLTADWHIGSEPFSALAYDILVDDVKDNKVKDIVVCGNILQGLCGRKLGWSELLEPRLDRQIDLAERYLKQIPSGTKIAMISGVNEEAAQKRYRRYDTLKILARRIPNATFYGQAANLKLGDRFTLMAVHGKGRNPYASSSPIQKAYEKLSVKPNIFVMGHFHELFCMNVPHGRLLIKPGTLARETIYDRRRGITPQVGWYILHEYDREHDSIEVRFPRVY